MATKNDDTTGREARPAQSRGGSRFASQPEAPRARTGIGHGQDVRQGTQGIEGARGAPRPGRRQAALRGRTDAAHAPAAEARIHEPVPGRESARAARCAQRSRGNEVTNESLVAAGLIRKNKGPAKVLNNGELTRAVTRARHQGERFRARFDRRGGRPCRRVKWRNRIQQKR